MPRTNSQFGQLTTGKKALGHLYPSIFSELDMLHVHTYPGTVSSDPVRQGVGIKLRVGKNKWSEKEGKGWIRNLLFYGFYVLGKV